METLKTKDNLETDKESEAIPLDIDINSTDFYNKGQENVDSDLARIKTSIDIVKQLRMTAAEMEVETAALYHATLFENIEKLKSTVLEIEEKESYSNK